MSQSLDELDASSTKPDIRVAFFDIDGTLLDRQGRYSDNLKHQLARVRARGVRTAIASGRPHFGARFLIDELDLVDPGVFCTGAQVYSPSKGATLLSASMQGEDCRGLLRRLRELPLYYELYGTDGFYIETDYAAEVQKVHAQHLRQVPQRGALDRVVEEGGLLKWVLGVRKDEPQDLLGQLEREFSQFAFAYAAFPACPDWHFVNVIAREASKEKAFAWLLDHYQVTPAQVASFGDSHSDEVFLRSAGYGVAMGNAADTVKSAARFVTKCAWDDGVAYALARLI